MRIWGFAGAELLRSHGYRVINIIGNQAAKVLLTPEDRYDLFIVGHAAPEETRQEMVAWLKSKYPGVKIVALNPPNQQVAGADHNILQNAPETWLPIVHRQLAIYGDSPPPDKGSTAVG